MKRENFINAFVIVAGFLIVAAICVYQVRKAIQCEKAGGKYIAHGGYCVKVDGLIPLN